MPTNKAKRLAADVLALTVVLRRQAAKAIEEHGGSKDPFERGEAIG